MSAQEPMLCGKGGDEHYCVKPEGHTGNCRALHVSTLSYYERKQLGIDLEKPEPKL